MLLGQRLARRGALSADAILTAAGPVYRDINPRLVEPANAWRRGGPGGRPPRGGHGPAAGRSASGAGGRGHAPAPSGRFGCRPAPAHPARRARGAGLGIVPSGQLPRQRRRTDPCPPRPPRRSPGHGGIGCHSGTAGDVALVLGGSGGQLRPHTGRVAWRSCTIPGHDSPTTHVGRPRDRVRGRRSGAVLPTDIWAPHRLAT